MKKKTNLCRVNSPANNNAPQWSHSWFINPTSALDSGCTGSSTLPLHAINSSVPTARASALRVRRRVRRRALLRFRVAGLQVRRRALLRFRVAGVCNNTNDLTKTMIKLNNSHKKKRKNIYRISSSSVALISHCSRVFRMPSAMPQGLSWTFIATRTRHKYWCRVHGELICVFFFNIDNNNFKFSHLNQFKFELLLSKIWKKKHKSIHHELCTNMPTTPT